MSRSIDPRRPLPEDVKPALRGDKRTGPIGTIVPGDHKEVARDIQRLWLALDLLKRRVTHTAGPGSQHTLLFEANGLGAELVADSQDDAPITFPCTIVDWVLVADQAGDLVVDIWKAPGSDFPPTVADTITGGNQPALSSDSYAESDDLDGWITDIQAGDVLRFNIDSCATIQRAVLALGLQA